MTNDKKTSRVRRAASLLGAVMLVAGGLTITAVAQEETSAQKPAAKRAASSGRDPFKKYEPAKATTMKRMADQSPVPTIQERITRYKAQKAAAMTARMPAPKPTTALLLSEIQVIGISRTPRGYAAIIEATPIKLSYVIYPGEPFYDGLLVAIEDNRLVFRRETVFSDGRREKAVEYKPLRQPSPVNAMPVPGAAATTQSVATATP